MQVLIRIGADDPFPATWAEFAAENADDFGPAELAKMEAVLDAGGRYITGGGAGPLVIITPAGVR